MIFLLPWPPGWRLGLPPRRGREGLADRRGAGRGGLSVVRERRKRRRDLELRTYRSCRANGRIIVRGGGFDNGRAGPGARCRPPGHCRRAGFRLRCRECNVQSLSLARQVGRSIRRGGGRWLGSAVPSARRTAWARDRCGTSWRLTPARRGASGRAGRVQARLLSELDDGPRRRGRRQGDDRARRRAGGGVRPGEILILAFHRKAVEDVKARLKRCLPCRT